MLRRTVCILLLTCQVWQTTFSAGSDYARLLAGRMEKEAPEIWRVGIARTRLLRSRSPRGPQPVMNTLRAEALRLNGLSGS